MENVCRFSGELEGVFAGEATFNDRGAVNQSSEDDSLLKQPKKSQLSTISVKKVPTHNLTMN